MNAMLTAPIRDVTGRAHNATPESTTFTAASAAALVKACDVADVAARDAFVASATGLHRTVHSGVTISAVRAEVLKLGVRKTRTSNAYLGYHALTGAVLVLPVYAGTADAEDRAFMAEYIDTPSKIQTIVERLYNNGCTKIARATIAGAASQIEAIRGLMADDVARIERESAVIVSASEKSSAVATGEGGEGGDDVPDAPVSDTVDVDAMLRAITGPIGKLSGATATQAQADAARALIDSLSRFAGTAVQSGAVVGDSPERVSGQIVRPRAPQSFGPLIIATSAA
jgi:hypothetical protein